MLVVRSKTLVNRPGIVKPWIKETVSSLVEKRDKLRQFVSMKATKWLPLLLAVVHKCTFWVNYSHNEYFFPYGNSFPAGFLKVLRWKSDNNVKLMTIILYIMSVRQTDEVRKWYITEGYFDFLGPLRFRHSTCLKLLGWVAHIYCVPA